MKAKKDKPVICETTLTAYFNISLASQATGCSRDGISRVCDGKQVSVKDKHGNKLSFRYAIEVIHDKGLDWFRENVSLGQKEDIQQAMEGGKH